jgi:hypothetical protein
MPQLWRFEHGQLERIVVADLGAWLAVVGLRLSLKAYPAGDPIRDRAHIALLERFRARLHPDPRWQIEVPLPIERDLRAWDAVISHRGEQSWRVRVEAETKLVDLQAVERKLTLKVRDDPYGRVVLLVADTAGNRRALRSARDGLRELLSLDTRRVLSALGEGREPEGNGIVIL